ncbi:pyridoxamine 5'-phosphate oxidase-domain-containing protein [Crucibulum laeve]|uniref:Pyridoxamine 5'-phosphate oxidase-domain-containing protein n=1 Tax=Crucibulum laeve TaxID=68775 RepID=A0A5C3MLU6_9AGAR|nr:pyridoxamine 5'-phosphate oxidase-domain-containing protein [Crucibulum laeve]
MASSSIPRWKVALQAAISKYEKQTVFQLATLDPTSAIPHVRSHIFRAFLESSKYPSLPLLISSTDIRTPKITQIATHPDIELAWWIEGANQQFRVTARAYIVSDPKFNLHEHFMQTLFAAKPETGSGLAIINSEGLNWEAKRLEIFKTMSGHMKASWCRPTPGSKLDNPEDAKKWPETVKEPKEGDSEEVKKNWDIALGNFALLVLDPFEVDFVDMSIIPNERAKFYRTTKGEWEEVSVVP